MIIIKLKENMKFGRLFIAISSVLLSTSSFAQYTAMDITGSAGKEFSSIQKSFTTGAADIKAAMAASTKDATAAIGSSASSVNKAIISSSMKKSSDASVLTSSTLKTQIDFQADLAAKEARSNTSPVFADDTPEEIDFILEYLSKPDIKNQNLRDVIDFAKKELDGKQSVSVIPHSSRVSGCKDDECGYDKKINPGLKIESYAEMCAVAKRGNLDRRESLRAENTTRIASAKKTMDTVRSSSSSDSIRKKVDSQRELTCTPDLKKVGRCGDGLSNEEYVEKVLSNEIIPNGGLSANNFYSPQSIGGQGFLDLSDEKYEQVKYIKEKDSVVRVTGGKSDLPAIINTYRNSQQLKAASSFVDNIINMEAVSNQPQVDRMSARSAEFQSAFISRNASLEMAKSTFDSSISSRKGSSLTGANLDSGEIIKESEDGAGRWDRLRHEVERSKKLVEPENIDKLAAASEGKLLTTLIEQGAIKNKMLFDELMALESQELLMATMLANEVNSPENIRYINRLGGGR